MTDRLAELEKLLDRATPGPWEVYDANEGTGISPLWAVANDAFHNPPDDDDTPWIALDVHVGGREDAELIAAAPQDLRNLVAVVKAVVPIAEALERPCWYDHHGYCQAHWLHEKPCPVESLDAALANLGGPT